jgi:hypothetical protein
VNYSSHHNSCIRFRCKKAGACRIATIGTRGELLFVERLGYTLSGLSFLDIFILPRVIQEFSSLVVLIEESGKIKTLLRLFIINH